jgi:hypothetical protein
VITNNNNKSLNGNTFTTTSPQGSLNEIQLPSESELRKITSLLPLTNSEQVVALPSSSSSSSPLLAQKMQSLHTDDTLQSMCQCIQAECASFSDQCHTKNDDDVDGDEDDMCVFPLTFSSLLNFYIGTDCEADLKKVKKFLSSKKVITNYLILLLRRESDPKLRFRLSRSRILHTLLDCGGDLNQCWYYCQ